LIDEILAVLLAVNMLLITVVMAFCYKLNHDWSRLIDRLNTEWGELYKLQIGAYDDDEGDGWYEQ
jgi:hypothetical protein